MPTHEAALHVVTAAAEPEDLGPAAFVLHVDDAADRSALWRASGWSVEAPISRAQLVCACGWRSSFLTLPPDARYVTRTTPGVPATLALILSGDAYLTCTSEWYEHADDDAADALLHHHGRLPRDLPTASGAHPHDPVPVYHSPQPVDAPAGLSDVRVGDWPPIVGRRDPRLTALTR